LYELGSAAEWPKEEPIKNFDFVVSLLDQKIWEIQDRNRTLKPPIIFTSKGGNFRNEVATLRPYKGSRKDKVKPFHYRN
ncbi:hypothetical protein P9279_30645, partial [Mesorhizobium sp. WSM4962]|uniref:hypothetical protein n=1 Tax=Mesorhizobium sp. WSM4962 TaxID=3038548 RepID=UPI002415DF5F